MGAGTRQRGWIRGALCALVLFICAGALLAGPAAAAPTAITEYPVEVGNGANLENLTVGPDGKLWFADGYWPEGAFHALIGRFDPSDGSTVEFDQGLGHFSVIRDFVPGPDGNMWFADSGSAGTDAAIGKVTPTGQITEYASPVGGKPESIIDGPDGALWFAASGAIGRVTTTGSLEAYELPGVPGELAAGPDGNVWFTYGGGEDAAIGRVERHPDETATITLFGAGLGSQGIPERIVASGGYLWFTDLSGLEPAIGRVSTNGHIVEFHLEPGSVAADIAAGPDGNVWFIDTGVGAIGRITPDGQISEFTSEDIEPFLEYRNEVGFTLHHLVAGPDGNMWFTIRRGRAELGKITPAGAITTFGPGQAGLSANGNAKAQEIAAGPHGELWFDSDAWDPATSTSRATIGRIVPGDDSKPADPGSAGPGGPTKLPSPPPPAPRITLPGGRILKEDGHGKLHLRITCQSVTPCAGAVRLTFPPSKKVVTSAAFALAAGTSMSLKIWLPRGTRRLLATKHRQVARLSLAGLNGTSMAPTRVVLKASPPA